MAENDVFPQDSSSDGTEAAWLRAAEWIASHMGLHFPAARRPELERALSAAAREWGWRDADDAAQRLPALAPSRDRLESLARHLTVGETYFFRDAAVFDALRDAVLPKLLRARSSTRRLRIWSAGCCTGEEPYSIAMTLAAALPQASDWNISILATDIDAAFLARARAGLYGEWSFRGTQPDVRRAFFEQEGPRAWRVSPRIRSLVKFEHLNLAADSFPSLANGTNAMDIVFCRNVLMYFEPARARQVLARLGEALREDGWLFLNPVEIPHVRLPQLMAERVGDALVLRKAGALPMPPARAAIEPPAHGTPPTPSAAGLPEPEAAAASLPPQPPAAPALSGAADFARRARSCADAGDLEGALRACERAIEGDKLDPGHHFLHANILQELDREAEAMLALRRTLFLRPSHVLAHVAIGNIARRQGLPGAAERHFRQALAVLDDPAEAASAEFEGMDAARLADAIRSRLATQEDA